MTHTVLLARWKTSHSLLPQESLLQNRNSEVLNKIHPPDAVSVLHSKLTEYKQPQWGFEGKTAPFRQKNYYKPASPHPGQSLLKSWTHYRFRGSLWLIFQSQEEVFEEQTGHSSEMLVSEMGEPYVPELHLGQSSLEQLRHFSLRVGEHL